MATSYAPLLLQAFDDYGAMLAGGKLYTYEAGTTTPLATYQDLAGSTANTNPVILDSAGRAVVRVTNGVSYKFVLTDSDGNIIETLDDIIVGADVDTNGSEYLVHLSYEGTPAAQGFMAGHIFDDAVTFPIDFEGAQLWVEVAPASEYVVSLKRNGTEIGTITIATDGTYTFATTGGTTVAFTAGQRLVAYGPDTVGSAANFIITIPGELA